MSIAPSRFAWEDALRNTHGLPSPVTRLVLAWISTYCMRKADPQCWPSLSALETATGLSRPTLIDHINQAVALGWLRKETGQMKGMKRRGSIYTLTLPTGKPSLDRSTMRQPVNPDLTGQQSRPVKLTPPTGKADGVQPVKHPTAESLPELEVLLFLKEKENKKGLEGEDDNVNGPDINPVLESKGKSNGEDKVNIKGVRQGELTPIETWAAAAGLVRSAAETDIEFRKRASGAWVDKQAAAVPRGSDDND
ncbi:MAG: helix-turn-helix domain-containing protein [Pseudomonadota bacterium]